MPQHLSPIIFPIGKGLFTELLLPEAWNSLSHSFLESLLPAYLMWQGLPFSLPFFLALRRNGSAGHRGSLSWLGGCARPPPECGPLEWARWEGPRQGGVLGPSGRRGGGGCGQWAEPLGSGCPGEATLGSVPRARRTGRGADSRGWRRGSGSGVLRRAPGTLGLRRWGGGVRRCRPRGTALPCLTRSQAAAAPTILTRSGWKPTTAGECPGVGVGGEGKGQPDLAWRRGGWGASDVVAGWSGRATLRTRDGWPSSRGRSVGCWIVAPATCGAGRPGVGCLRVQNRVRGRRSLGIEDVHPVGSRDSPPKKFARVYLRH